MKSQTSGLLRPYRRRTMDEMLFFNSSFFVPQLQCSFLRDFRVFLFARLCTTIIHPMRLHNETTTATISKHCQEIETLTGTNQTDQQCRGRKKRGTTQKASENIRLFSQIILTLQMKVVRQRMLGRPNPVRNRTAEEG